MVIGDFSFKRFAQQQFYREVNQHLIQLSDIQPGQHVVDLACGVGTVTGMIVEKLQGAKDSVVIGVDSSTEALQSAREALEKAGKGIVKFVQGGIDQLSQVVRERADTVFLCNAIHLIQDKRRLLAEVYNLLRRGGMFAFNTAFFDGAIPIETEQFYRRWMIKAIRTLKRQHDLMPQRVPKAEARKPLTPGQYAELLERHDFALRYREICPVALPLEGWLGISQYEEFIIGALPGVPLEQGSQALQEGVRQTFQEMNLKGVLRNWLSVVAVRQ